MILRRKRMEVGMSTIREDKFQIKSSRKPSMKVTQSKNLKEMKESKSWKRTSKRDRTGRGNAHLIFMNPYNVKPS